MRKCVCASIMLALSAVAVAACGSSKSGTASSGVGSSKPYAELRWGSAPTTRLDFTTNLETGSSAMEALAVQNLMEFEQSGKVKPGPATRSVEHPNTTTYIYNLKSGVRFSDGKPLTAADVVYSLKRNLGKEAQTASSFANVASIAESGPLTVVVKLKQPNASWPDIPAFAGQIIEMAAAERVGESNLGTPSGLPIGTGPWKIDSFSPTTGVQYSRNPYWTGPTPPARRISVDFFKEESAEALALRSGAIDGCFPVSVLKSFLDIPGTHLLIAPGTGSAVISMNTIIPPFNNIHVRRAIAYATNVKGMLQATWGKYAAIEHAVVPASVFAGLAPASAVNAMLDSLPKYEFNIAAAKRELEKSPYPHGFTTTAQVEISNDRGTVVGQILASDLAKIGINVKVQTMPSATWLATLYGPRKAIKLFPVEYASVFPDPDALMYYWLAPEAAKVNGLNSANYTNPEVGRLLKEEDMASNPHKRLELISKILRISMEDVPYQPQYSPDYVSVLSDRYVWPTFATTTIFYTAWAMDVRLAH